MRSNTAIFRFQAFLMRLESRFSNPTLQLFTMYNLHLSSVSKYHSSSNIPGGTMVPLPPLGANPIALKQIQQANRKHTPSFRTKHNDCKWMFKKGQSIFMPVLGKSATKRKRMPLKPITLANLVFSFSMLSPTDLTTFSVYS